MSKIDIGPRYRNLLAWSYEIDAELHPQSPVFPINVSYPPIGWYRSPLLNKTLFTSTSIPDYGITNINEGFARLYSGSGTGDDVYMHTTFPMAPETTYKISGWYKLVSYSTIGQLNTCNAFNVMQNYSNLGIQTRAALSFSSQQSKFLTNVWTKYELTWTTSNITNILPWIFICETWSSGFGAWVWGVELNVINPGPMFFNLYPSLRNQLTY